MKPPGDYQSTPISDDAHRAPTLEPTPEAAPPARPGPAAAAAPAESPIATRTGVVFVHGIGTQGPGETFLDWSAPIVELLTDWRTARDGPAGAPPVEGLADPVRRAEFSFNAASQPYLELSIPSDGDVAASTWVVTEAWWASDIRPPDIGRVIDYLRRRMGTLVTGIVTGYRDRAPRLVVIANDAALVDAAKLPRSWRLIDRLDQAQATAFGARPIGWAIAGAGTLALIGYDLLRRIPIGALQDFAVRKMVDNFLVDWFGDLPVLIDDPVQSANVRARLAGAIRRLRDDGCDAIVLVAHSGGALVSFETLLDPAYLDLRVDKLVTLGQGLGLAWRLAADPEVHEIPPGSRLVGDLAAVRPDLRWVDVWASYDPAPAGPLPTRGGLFESADESAAIVDTGQPGEEPWLIRKEARTSDDSVAAFVEASALDPGARRIVVESRPVTNEMNVLTDHGGYWANTEGFLVPLIRHLDAARGEATASRFYRDPAARTRRIVWRRQRVAALAAWGWLCSLTALATVAVLVVLGVVGDPRLAAAGDALAAAWSLVPGHQVISGPIDGIGALVQGMADSVGLGDVTAWLASFGPALLAVGFTVLLFYVVANIGASRWHAWDARERRAMLPEIPILPDRSRAAAQSIALVGGLAGLILATFGFGIAMVLVITVSGVAGILVWARAPFRS